MEKIRVSVLAKELQVSTTTIYKHTKRLKDRLSGHLLKESGIFFLDTIGAETIRSAIQATTATPEPVVSLPAFPPVDLAPVLSRSADIEKAILTLAEAFKRETDRLRSDNESLRKEVQALRLSLAPPEKIKEKTLSDEIAEVQEEVKAFFSGIFAPFSAWFKGA